MKRCGSTCVGVRFSNGGAGYKSGYARRLVQSSDQRAEHSSVIEQRAGGGTGTQAVGPDQPRLNDDSAAKLAPFFFRLPGDNWWARQAVRYPLVSRCKDRAVHHIRNSSGTERLLLEIRCGRLHAVVLRPATSKGLLSLVPYPSNASYLLERRKPADADCLYLIRLAGSDQG